MAKGMDRGNVGRTNKPKLSIKERQLKKKLKKMAKSGVSTAQPQASHPM